MRRGAGLTRRRSGTPSAVAAISRMRSRATHIRPTKVKGGSGMTIGQLSPPVRVFSEPITIIILNLSQMQRGALAVPHVPRSPTNASVCQVPSRVSDAPTRTLAAVPSPPCPVFPRTPPY